MGTVNALATTWGPALLICLTVVLGMVYNNSRHTDTNSRIDDLRNHVDKRFDDLKDFVKSEIRRVEERQSPIHRA